MKTVRYKTNINCDSCIISVTPVLNQLDNVEWWSVDTGNPDKVLTVELDDENSEIVAEAVREAGFEIESI